MALLKPGMHIHFIGIGGIGMSAIATVLAEQGYRVSGCDTDLTQQSIRNLQALGCTISGSHDSEICLDPSIDMIVYSTDIRIRSELKEIQTAKARAIPIVHRADLLAELIAQHTTSIAVAGCHGKTTTTSLLSHLFLKTNQDPTFIIGGHLNELSNNARAGKSPFLIAEADESDRSFLKFHPTYAVVTNIDRDHLDTYRDLEDIIATFCQFLQNIRPEGAAVVCIDDQNVKTLLNCYSKTASPARVITYGQSSDAQYQTRNIVNTPTGTSFAVKMPNGIIVPVLIPLSGTHNALNATAAFAIACEVGIKPADAALALASFGGVDQRFTYRGIFQEAQVFDDYGHHPTEIKNVLGVARNKTDKQLIVVFQPHRYTRTKELWNEFVDVFATAPVDQLIITDIYPASEQPIPNITSTNLIAALKAKNPKLNVTHVAAEKEWTSLKDVLKKSVSTGDLLLFLGAGKVNRLSLELVKE